MISLTDAKASNFTTSTRAELNAYATELGLEPPKGANAAVLRKMVLNALGMTDSNHGAPSAPPSVKSGGESDKIFPSYNLTPSGIWGGRRHRISLPRPEGSRLAQAEGFVWNGKHTYYVPYDEVIDVPEPIYQILVTNKRRRPTTIETQIPGGGTEKTTGWEFDNISFQYIGADPETQNRAGSMMEWYQSRGSEFFKKLTMRQMQLIAQKVELPTEQRIGPGVPPRVLGEDELRGRLLEFFFGYADAEAEANDKIAA